ncbi:hypothetical protein PSN45_001486 [Yamadazyma tenuis]|uniref:uncharacterized protein n=1 Tax=Candida tenuis TaxID=2315449 RepID=UPI0027A5E591|nr:hypothetical protein PSN45_001486 [Yamadazyma tenuis]
MNTWTIVLAVELIVFVIALLVTFYVLFATYQYLKENDLFYLHVLFLYPSFWQALSATLGLVYITQAWQDVWFILNSFFEILGTAFTLVYLNRILKLYFRKTGTSYSLFNYPVLFFDLAAVILCLVGLIQLTSTFVYYKAGVVVLTSCFVILEIVTIVNLLSSPHKKFFGLITVANTLMVANGAYYIYIAFNEIMLFQWANYILFVVLVFVTKFVCLAMAPFMVSSLTSIGGKEE